MNNTHKLSWSLTTGKLVFLLVLLIRILSVIFTLLTGLNPYAQADIFGFIVSAEQIAIGIEQGEYVTADESSTYQRWGLFLAPFWLLPGPSLLYASIVNAFVGSFAIYNVYIIVQYYHTHYAGVLAVAPLAIFPSVVLIHGTPLREAVILFGITVAARVLLVSEQRSRAIQIAIVGLSLFITTFHRPDNFVIFLIAIGGGCAVYLYQEKWLAKAHIYSGIVVSIIMIILFRDRIHDGFNYLTELRKVRTRGRTAYLTEVVPVMIPDFIAFSWIGAMYFLFSPFPWMIENVQDLVVGVEGMIILSFTLAIPFGVRHFVRQNLAGTVGLTLGLVSGAILYGFGTGNVGTAVRHRPMFVWVIFIFGAIGIANRVRISVDIRDETEQSTPNKINSDSI